MKTIKNIKIINILVMVSALMILTGGSAGAASKANPQGMTLQVPSMEKFHGAAKVHEFKMPGNTIPDGAGSGKGLGDFRPESAKTAPDAAVQELDLHGETRLAAKLPKGGYFMKMYTQEQAVNEDLLSGQGLAPGSVNPPVSDPKLDGIEHQADMPPDVPQSPVNDKIDPSYLGGPDREFPHPNGTEENFNDYQRWVGRNLDSDLNNENNFSHGGSDHNGGIYEGKPKPGSNATLVGQGDKDKWHSMNESDDEPDYDFTVDMDFGKGGNNGGNDNNTGEGSETTVDKSVEDEEGGQDADRDSDPEGDDPDEIMNPASAAAGRSATVSAMKAEAAFGNTSGGSNGSGQDSGGPGYQESMPQERGLPSVNIAERSGTGDPEDGGPDEMASPASGAINHAMVNGANYQPEPGGGDPGDPRASEGGNMIAVGTLGYAASPAVGDEGGKDPGPVGPEF